MLINILNQYPYFSLCLIALLINIPLGYIRENCPKFSFAWIFWIHSSIPLLIAMRISLGTSKLLIPVTILFAIIGQIWGSRLRRNQMTMGDMDRLNQIPPFQKIAKESFNESEVMVVLLNMGGPKTNAEVPGFLKKLFSDSLLIRLPLSILFQKLFAQILSLYLSERAQKRYQLIGGGSPIFQSTQNQTDALKKELKKRGRNIEVTFAFNYSDPYPQEAIHTLKQTGRNAILPLSLYPHYSKATTGSSLHYLKKAAQGVSIIQILNTPSYHLHDGYIQAFVDRILNEIKSVESLNDFYLLFSAHSIPLYLLKEGDLYPFQIAQTVAKILNALGRDHQWSISYQSAVGLMQWIKPFTHHMIKSLAAKNIKKLLIVPISFVTDHIETLCEIDIEYRKLADDSGIKDYRMSKAIECHPGFIQALADSVESSI